MNRLGLLLLLTCCSPAISSPSSEEFMVIEQESSPHWPAQALPVRSSTTPPPAAPSKLMQVIRGAASWYGPGFYGRTTASGERLRKGTLTAAHRTLPFGTRVRVTNLNNGRSVIVRINDRGPFRYHRVIDLAHGAAQELRMMKAGEVPVRLEVIEK